jgi:hypothetical protein
MSYGGNMKRGKKKRENAKEKGEKITDTDNITLKR